MADSAAKNNERNNFVSWWCGIVNYRAFQKAPDQKKGKKKKINWRYLQRMGLGRFQVMMNIQDTEKPTSATPTDFLLSDYESQA